MKRAATDSRVPSGPGSVSGAPNLPAGFADTFEGRYVLTGELRQHVVIGGEMSYGPLVGESMKPLADNVQGVVLPGTGHWVAENAPDELVDVLTTFLGPYRDASAATKGRRPEAAAAV